MSKEVSEENEMSADCQSMREYSHAEEFIANVPYIAMTLLGTLVFVWAFGASMWGWITGSVYLIYGAAGALWIMIFVCPYCRYWNTRSCPCGYGRIAARLREGKSEDRFNEKFKKHIPVIVPLWILPILAGVPVVVRAFSWPFLILLLVFGLDAFVVLPLISKQHGCRECPQRDTCPWMKRTAGATD